MQVVLYIPYFCFICVKNKKLKVSNLLKPKSRNNQLDFLLVRFLTHGTVQVVVVFKASIS